MEFFQDKYSVEKVNRYVTCEKLGEGTFGEVKKATDRLTGKTVAVKFVRIMSRQGGIPKAVFRELESLRQLSECEFIVTLSDVYADEMKLCLVMEYVESDLSEIISRSPRHILRSHVKAYTHMMLQAVSFCHQHKVVHRDIKPANLLISSKGVIKLADFGLARICELSQVGGIQSMSHQVATRQYRAPELLFASRRYDFAVDVWSCAVILCELFLQSTLFPGTSDLDQMTRVFQSMGSPTEENWPGVGQLPDFSKVSFPKMSALPLALVVPSAHPDDLVFIDLLLQLDPKKRLTTSEACVHPYFTQQMPLPASSFDLIVPARPTKTPKSDKPVQSLKEVMQRSRVYTKAS